LTESLKAVRPTVFFGVPRVWEKIMEKMKQVGRSTTGLKKTISTWAKEQGTNMAKRAQFGGDYGTSMTFGCANGIVLSKIKALLGLDCAKGCFTAAAPISPEVIWYFGSLGIPLFEVFGQSECTGPHTVSFHKEWKVGTCGRPIYGSESMIVPENGELCYRGRHIFMGYMYMEDKTKETIDPQGFLHSGDVAEFDGNDKLLKNGDREDMVGPSGFMKITGRIKELIITKGGENIPPVLIENAMKDSMVAISNCMVVGDKRKYLTMLVSLKTEVDPETGVPTDALAKDALDIGKDIGSSATTMSEAAKDPKWNDYIDSGRKAANAKAISNAQAVQKFVFLPVDFSEKAGDLTPTLKLKRSVVTKKYETLIDEMYGEKAE
jgi:long-chain-fatty-acid--CoA ligase ACSBG